MSEEEERSEPQSPESDLSESVLDEILDLYDTRQIRTDEFSTEYRKNRSFCSIFFLCLCLDYAEKDECLLDDKHKKLKTYKRAWGEGYKWMAPAEKDWGVPGAFVLVNEKGETPGELVEHSSR